jgi:4-diphosphocytidyl-2-C-methyl-D-erythritol kinase
VPAARAERAPAKINLTLRVLGRRADGYHELESLVVFAAVGDTLTFASGRRLSLAVRGLTAGDAGDIADNLVLKAARALAERIEGLRLGRFVLAKRLPVAAGLGGGSADAGAALRLIARANRIARDDPRLLAAARATGADVPVCLDPRPRVMRGIGEILSAPLDLPRLPAVLVNPGVAVATKDVFAALRLSTAKSAGGSSPSPLVGEGGEGGRAWGTDHASRSTPTPDPSPQGGGEKRAALLRLLVKDRNDLEAPAIRLQPVIADVLKALRALDGCRLARMSGSGATCFGLFDSQRLAMAAARTLRTKHSGWWIRATALG